MSIEPLLRARGGISWTTELVRDYTGSSPRTRRYFRFGEALY